MRPESHAVYMNSMKINEVFFHTHFPFSLLRAYMLCVCGYVLESWKKDVVNGFFYQYVVEYNKNLWKAQLCIS